MNENSEVEKRIAALEAKLESASTFERWVRIVSMLGAVVVFGLGVLQYYDTKEQEFRKAFWEKQYDLYSKATAAAAQIVTAKGLASIAAERKVFWELYWGQLAIVEDRRVMLAMADFGISLDAWERGNAKLVQPELSYRLARACRNSLKATWEPAPIDDLPGDRK